MDEKWRYDMHRRATPRNERILFGLADKVCPLPQAETLKRKQQNLSQHEPPQQRKKGCIQITPPHPDKASVEAVSNLFRDENGAFTATRVTQAMADQTHWSLAALARCRTNVARDRAHNPQGGHPRRISLDKTKALSDLIHENGRLKRRQMDNEFRDLDFNTWSRDPNRSDKFSPPSRSTLYRRRKEGDLIDRQPQRAQTAARDFASNSQRTFIRTAVGYEVLSECFGVPETHSMPQITLVTNGDAVLQEKETKEQDSYSRRLRPEHVIAYDESLGITYKIGKAVMQKKGTKHVKQKGLQAIPHAPQLQQGYNLVFGCTAAGRQLPPVVGIRSNKIKPGTYYIIDLPKFDSNFVGPAHACIVLHNKDDKKLLPKIFRERILNPTCEFLKLDLTEGEFTVVFGDGGCDEHNEPVLSDAFIEEIERLRQILVKTHVNATGKTSLCDLIALFKMIKQPDDALAHLDMAEYEFFVNEMVEMLDVPLTSFISKSKRILMIEAMALLFRVILPRLRPFEIQTEWRKQGLLPLNPDACFDRCDGPFPGAVRDLAKQNWPLMCTDMYLNGRLSDALMDNIFGANGENLDGKCLRSDGLVILSHQVTRQRVLARKARPQQLKAAKAQQKADEKDAKAKKRYDEIIARHGKKLTAAMKRDAIRYESAQVVAAGHKQTCMKCQIVLSVYDKWVPETSTTLRPHDCIFCYRVWVCAWCFTSSQDFETEHGAECERRAIEAADALEEEDEEEEDEEEEEEEEEEEDEECDEDFTVYE